MKSLSSKFAVLRIKGKQYKVAEGDEILVDHFEEDKVVFDVLLLANGEKVEVGKPIIEKHKVVVKVLGQEKGRKIDVLKYKAKSRYRKHIGFRPSYTRLKIMKIY